MGSKKATVIWTLLLLAVSYGIASAFAARSDSAISGSLGMAPGTHNAPAVRLIEESAAPEASVDESYWLNSGGVARVEDGEISTASGELPPDSKWRKAYGRSNPADTDGGKRPQNLFRLVTKRSYGDADVRGFFTVKALNLSDSPNRNESNGFFLMLRYADANDLYYAGLRVDGSAVLKKKIGGAYQTLATVPVFAYATYDRAAMPSLIPLNVPIGLRAQIRDAGDGSVAITMFMDIGGNGRWTRVLDATDKAGRIGSGHAGIRTDFMDVAVSGFKAESL